MTLKALVADDSGVMRKVIMRALREANLGDFEFAEASDGRQALTMFQKATYDVLFVDWNMPYLSGPELIRKIRADNRDVPIVLITSEKGPDRVEEATGAGANQLLSKPVTAERLRQTLQPLLPGA